MNHRFGLQQFKQPLDHRIDEIAGPLNVPQRTGATQLQPEHLVEQRGGLAQRDPQMRPAITHQQPGARPDIGVGALEWSRRLRHLATARATLSMPPITRDFHTRRRDVFDCVCVFVERARVFERSSTVETDLASQVVKMSLGPSATGGRTTPGCFRSPFACPSLPRFGREIALALGRNSFFRRCNSIVNSATGASRSTIRASR